MKNGLPSATYRLNVNTSSAAGNLNVGAENLFSIWAKSLGNARVFGGGRMAAYTNLDGGLQKFYFAQIEKVHAGKTMAIHLFDPGEASGNAYLRILSPDGNIYHYQTFDWTSDDGRVGRPASARSRRPSTARRSSTTARSRSPSRCRRPTARTASTRPATSPTKRAGG